MTDRVSLPEAVAPFAAALDEVCAAAQPIANRSMPMADAPGMKELSEEAPYSTDHWPQPIVNTFSMTGVLAFAGVDYVRGIARLICGDPLPVWSGLPLARAAMDASSLAFWLAAPGVGARARAQRGMAMRLHDAAQQRRAPSVMTQARANSKRMRAEIKGASLELGWGAISGRDAQAKVGTEEVPLPRAAIAAVLGEGRDDDLRDLAEVQWWYYSGATHAAPYALMQAFDRDGAVPSGIDGLLNSSINVKGVGLVSSAAEAGRAVINACTAIATLHGHDLVPLKEADQQMSRIALDLLEGFERATATDADASP